MTTAKKFTIISSARAKSSYLVDLLNSHPDVVCHSEFFHPDLAMLKLEKTHQNETLFNVSWRDQHPQLFLQQVYAETENQYPNTKLIGSKLLLYAYQINRGLEALLDDKPRVIYLYRENKLAWYSSLKIAMQTNVWSVTQPNLLQAQITFDPKDYISMVENQLLLEKMIIKILKEHNHETLSIEYDAIDQSDTIHKILHFLELANAPLKSIYVQQNSKNILSRFTNPQVVKSFARSIGKSSWLA